jgi:hypothetical protein
LCSLAAFAQNDNPYAAFGYEGNILKTPQERRRIILIIQNPDTTSSVASLGIDPRHGKYYFFNNLNEVLETGDIARDRLARFLSVDPIANKCPELTAYQFASNTPIQAIDLDGLEAFVIHGTQEYKHRFSPAAVAQFIRITGNAQYNDKFSWGDLAGLDNSRFKERNEAALKLVTHIETTRAQMIKDGKITKDEPISLVGYSHGGSVAIQAAALLHEKYNIQVNLLTISSPAYNDDYVSDPTALPNERIKPNPEDPEKNLGINEHTHMVHLYDRVITGAGGKDYYERSDKHLVTNFLILEEDIKIPYDPKQHHKTDWFDGVRYHTQLPTANGFENYLETIPPMLPAPKSTGLDKK